LRLSSNTVPSCPFFPRILVEKKEEERALFFFFKSLRCQTAVNASSFRVRNRIKKRIVYVVFVVCVSCFKSSRPFILRPVDWTVQIDCRGFVSMRLIGNKFELFCASMWKLLLPVALY
jgi:hypothetical protein